MSELCETPLCLIPASCQDVSRNHEPVVPDRCWMLGHRLLKPTDRFLVPGGLEMRCPDPNCPKETQRVGRQWQGLSRSADVRSRFQSVHYTLRSNHSGPRPTMTLHPTSGRALRGLPLSRGHHSAFGLPPEASLSGNHGSRVIPHGRLRCELSPALPPVSR